MLQSVRECYRGLLSALECYRMLQRVKECYKVLPSVTGCYRILQSITEYYKDKSSASTWTNFWACLRKIACKSLMPENNVKVAAIYVKWIKGWARGIFKLLDADMKQ